MNDKPKIQEIIDDPELWEQLKELVLERLKVMPDNLRVAIGSTEFTKKDIIRHVEEGDETGRQMMEVELDFLRDLASGAVYANE